MTWWWVNLTSHNYSMGGGDIYVGGNMTWTNPSLPDNAYVVGDFKNTSGGGSVGGTIYYGGKWLMLLAGVGMIAWVRLR